MWSTWRSASSSVRPSPPSSGRWSTTSHHAANRRAHRGTLSGANYDSLAQAKEAGAPTINIGVFINNLISFVIVAVVLFMVIKAMNQLRRKQDEQDSPPPSREVQVLEEIRDVLVKRG